MLSNYLKWLGWNLVILFGLVVLWLLVGGLVLSGGNIAKTLAELPWAAFLYFGAVVVPAVLVLLVLARLSARLPVTRVRVLAVALSPIVLIAFVPTVLTGSQIREPALYLIGGLVFSLTFGLLLRLPGDHLRRGAVQAGQDGA